jgi:hypothetical protein
MNDTTSSPLPIALRAYAERPEAEKSNQKKKSSKRSQKPAAPSPFVLVVDTETTIDATQRLLYGCWRVLIDGQTVDEGLIAADDLPASDLATLHAYVQSHRADTAQGTEPIRLLTRREFLRQIFRPIAYKGRGGVAAFNLPFDASRVSVGFGIARKAPYTRGFSLAMDEYLGQDGRWHENHYRPRLAIKSIDSKRALKGFTRPQNPDRRDLIPEGADDGQPDPTYTFRGHFLDLRTLAFALTGKSHSLESACEAFGVEHGKEKPPEHGKITPQHIDYCRRDVQATSELYLKLAAEYACHPITLPMTHAYSPASLTKAYLKAMGIPPILERQPDFPKWALGAATQAYFGGRAECRIRRVPVPVVYLDFLSMYPTVCALMGIWQLYICERIEVVEATEEVETLLADLTLDSCFRPECWPQVVGLVLIQPDEDTMPVRAQYEGNGSDRTRAKSSGGKGNWQIGINPYTSQKPEWRSIADVVASTRFTGRPPKVLQAIRFVPQGIQPGLKPIMLRGTVPFDPRTQDFFRAVIEERQRVKSRTDLSKEERKRLDTFLKVLANALYGINAEMNRQDLPARDDTVDVDVYTGDEAPFTAKVRGPEEPGDYCFPPIAACITGAARLMLATLEDAVTDAGGTYAICDTDSMAIVATKEGRLVSCPGGAERLPDGREAIRALSWAEVDRIRERFAALNPYDSEVVPGSILKIEEDENFDADGQQRQLWCYAISAKRYALYILNEHGQPVICKNSEHGLGHLLNPMDPEDKSRDWISLLWEGLISEAHDREYAWPSWLDRSALGRITVSSSDLLTPFEQLNRGKSYAEQIKPFNFLLSAHIAPLGHPVSVDPTHFHLIAPYASDPRKWHKLAWVDRYSGQPYRITTSEEAALYGGNAVRVKTYHDVLAEYRTHPEPKSLGPDREVCGRQTVGLLQRRPVTRGTVTYVGKESNRLEEVEAGLVHDPEEVYTEYIDLHEDVWRTRVLPVLKQMPRRVLIEATGLSRSQVTAIRNGHAMPRTHHRAILIRSAENFASTQRTAAGQSTGLTRSQPGEGRRRPRSGV